MEPAMLFLQQRITKNQLIPLPRPLVVLQTWRILQEITEFLKYFPEMNCFIEVFNRTKSVVMGMAHLSALPGCIISYFRTVKRSPIKSSVWSNHGTSTICHIRFLRRFLFCFANWLNFEQFFGNISDDLMFIVYRWMRLVSWLNSLNRYNIHD